jgi:hypothetical protein
MGNGGTPSIDRKSTGGFTQPSFVLDDGMVFGSGRDANTSDRHFIINSGAAPLLAFSVNRMQKRGSLTTYLNFTRAAQRSSKNEHSIFVLKFH